MTPVRHEGPAARITTTASTPRAPDRSANTATTQPAIPSGGPEDGTGAPPEHRVVLIDPRPERSALMRLLLERSPVLKVVGMAATLAEAEEQIRSTQADVAIVEIQMPVVEGLAAIASLRGLFPELRIAVCSFHDDAATREAAMSYGANAYLSKPPSPRDLLALVAEPVRQPANAGPATS